MVVASVRQLLIALVKINIPKFIFCLVSFAITLALTVSGPWIVNYLVRSLMDEDHSELGVMLLLMLGYKLGGAVTNLVCDYLYSSLGF